MVDQCVQRSVQPELLDDLPPESAAARHNRRDMLRLNFLMGNFRWFGQILARENLPAGTRVVELAAGDGALGRFLHRRLPAARAWRYTGVDLWRRPADWPPAWQWAQADLRQDSTVAGAEVVLANHILHQFDDTALAAIAECFFPRTRLLVINETARARLHLWQARAMFLLGMNYVSRHDALVSVRAGFRGGELPRILGLEPEVWDCATRHTARGAYRLVARRREEAA